jgi:hypothetical protein
MFIADEFECAPNKSLVCRGSVAALHDRAARITY